METEMVYWGYIGIMEKQMETTDSGAQLRLRESRLGKNIALG